MSNNPYIQRDSLAVELAYALRGEPNGINYVFDHLSRVINDSKLTHSEKKVLCLLLRNLGSDTKLARRAIGVPRGKPPKRPDLDDYDQSWEIAAEIYWSSQRGQPLTGNRDNSGVFEEVAAKYFNDPPTEAEIRRVRAIWERLRSIIAEVEQLKAEAHEYDQNHT